MTRSRRKSRDEATPLPVSRPIDEGLPRHQASPTAVAAEALRTGLLPVTSPRRRSAEIPHEEQTILVGDPYDDTLTNEYVGEETPGGSNPTPDQSAVDEIGRAYGLQEEDAGILRSASEVLTRRDRHRSELQAPRKRAY